MNEVEKLLLDRAVERLIAPGMRMREAGWRTEIVAFAPEEIERIPGYKVALVVSLSPFEGDGDDPRIDAMERAADRDVKREEERDDA